MCHTSVGLFLFLVYLVAVCCCCVVVLFACLPIWFGLLLCAAVTARFFVFVCARASSSSSPAQPSVFSTLLHTLDFVAVLGVLEVTRTAYEDASRDYRSVRACVFRFFFFLLYCAPSTCSWRAFPMELNWISHTSTTRRVRAFGKTSRERSTDGTFVRGWYPHFLREVSILEIKNTQPGGVGLFSVG